jgi:hypothetical protein
MGLLYDPLKKTPQHINKLDGLPPFNSPWLNILPMGV